MLACKIRPVETILPGVVFNTTVSLVYFVTFLAYYLHFLAAALMVDKDSQINIGRFYLGFFIIVVDVGVGKAEFSKWITKHFPYFMYRELKHCCTFFSIFFRSTLYLSTIDQSKDLRVELFL